MIDEGLAPHATPAAPAPSTTAPDSPLGPQPVDEAPPQPVDPHRPNTMIDAMIRALAERKLISRAGPHGTYVLLVAQQPAFRPRTGPELGVPVAPPMTQEIAFTHDRKRPGLFAWYWIWGAGFRNAGDSDVERFADGEDIDAAADAIASVLRVNA